MREIPVLNVRDTLGDLVAQVATENVTIRLLHYGRPDGALVPLATASRLGLHLVDSHSVTRARASWAEVRRAAQEEGPQALVVESQHIAVLLGEKHARYLTEGVPELPGTSVYWDPEKGCLVTDTGHKLEPGPYQVDGQIVVFSGIEEAPLW